MTTALAVDLYEQQDDFVHDQRRYTAFIGGRNSGKTYSGSWKAFARATQGGLGLIGAPSFPQLEHGAKAQFIDRLNQTGVRYDLTRSGVKLPDHDSEIIFVTLESESRVRGPNYDWGWVDEIEYVTDRNIWKALKGAVRNGDNYQLFVTSTPKGRRLVWDEWVVGKTAHHALYKATTFDNPFIDAQDYVAGLGYEGTFYEQEITADFVTFEGLVYPKFDRDRNVAVVDCTGWNRILALDLGASNPTALLTIAYAGDRIHVEREQYRPMNADEVKAAALAEYAATRADFLVADPSGKIVTDALVGSIQLRQGQNAIIPGISTVASALATLTVDPSCICTIDEFESYAYPDGAKADRDVPLKRNDHAMDALRYAVMELASDAPAVASTGIAQKSRWG